MYIGSRLRSIFPSKEVMQMPGCFVIQPFDRGAFDKRYRDVLVPAIKEAGLEPYRVDEDPSATILIDDIEAGIRGSDICLADITNDNPNIWYEVGFAIANDKPVVLICASPRPTSPPFDVSHRQIIYYSLDAPSDFKKLEREITTRLKAQIKKTEAMQTVASLSPVKSTEGLSSYEIACLVSVMENRLTPQTSVTPREIQQDMRRAGYTEIAISLSLESLNRKGMVEFEESESNDFGNTYTVCKITQKGVDWLLENQERFEFTREDAIVSETKGSPQIKDEDIPF